MDAPDTGVVRSYDFTVARGTVAPDGFEKTTLLINGQFPGVRLRYQSVCGLTDGV